MAAGQGAGREIYSLPGAGPQDQQAVQRRRADRRIKKGLYTSRRARGGECERHNEAPEVVGRAHVPDQATHLRLCNHLGGRRHSTLRQLAIPTHRATGVELCAREPGLFNQI